MTYLTPEQHEQLLRPINPKRVGTDGKGFSHVEAYEIRAHLIRIFGPARWSADVTDQQLIFESCEPRQNKKGETYTAWTVCYRTIMRLTVCSPDGTVLATYTEGATGEATNQPSRGDAHDLALKTSESQALKRCGFNLGDQFGLSLFAKGSKAALVRRSLVTPAGVRQAPDTAGASVDAHITEPLPREDETPEPTPDPRVTNRPPETPVTPVDAAGAASPAAPAAPDLDKSAAAEKLRTQAVGERPAGYTPSKWIGHLMGQAIKQGIQTEKVESINSPNLVALRVLLEECLKRAADEERQVRAS